MRKSLLAKKVRKIRRNRKICDRESKKKWFNFVRGIRRMLELF